MAKHQENLKIVMRCSNATPIRGFGGVGYICYFCPVQFTNPAHLKAHITDYHPDFKHTTKKRQQPLSNYSIKLDITSLMCKMCSEPFEDLKPLMEHLRLDHAQPIHTDLPDYLLPLRLGSGKGPLKCALCDQEFNTFRMLLEHMRIHFRNYICEICDDGFINRQSCRKHMRLHEYSAHPCSQCHKVFTSPEKLKNHTDGVHLKLKRNICPFCNEKFHNDYSKKIHMERAHGMPLQPVKCMVCGRMFRHQGFLKRHMSKAHLPIKRFECELCHKNYNCNSKLRDHRMITHMGVRNFKCDICGKAFGHKQTLRKHSRIHTEDRRYKCAHCEYVFLHKWSLKTHLFAMHVMEMG